MTGCTKRLFFLVHDCDLIGAYLVQKNLGGAFAMLSTMEHSDAIFDRSTKAECGHLMIEYNNINYITFRMTASCHQKCVSTQYHQGDLEKGEVVCIDRCVAKYLDIHEQIGKKLTQISQADEEAVAKMANAPGTTALKP